MNQGVYPLAASMVNQINRLDQISNNLANADTIGFKQEGTAETTFNWYLQKMENSPKKKFVESITINNIPKIDTRYTDPHMGAIRTTGNDLDFALNAYDTFFKIQDENGDILYTRNGAFKNQDGFLVDGNGNNVLNQDNEAIIIEDNFQLEIGIAQTGFKNLEKVGDNNYRALNLDLVENLENNDNQIILGAVEQSNVNRVTTMVELIDAHRRFDQSQKAIKTIDELNAGLIEKIGNTR
ncbi:Flagellar basal-body rod protein FlgG [Aliarcobacter thereius]|uniref:Flagellar basal-body rod protein FlgG n=2 Tax=Aliarcobacter thereius TaxID=544718 RepID=A0A1C0B960_9BACT|nr:flagellar hook-basal body protein [Aliarcobacter thereius]OCL88725.1 Flagellar basal-body rod protein FlgG [Aliarcobacter thereius]OCL92220.1 Flagellar basal-body rod protein FlgG [Aliarcobacter thereius]OCL94684.1 Flagellar basal-body rod protein FlgG [Aliarcobacter thereius LMG 24486]OCM00130.1 Flagellar basal-body rod protein FlgG [Aliarcobacter thereius]QBF15440.1 flagellar distal rod protein FlgG [Aliarcobacter thereius LMG 24486]